MGEVIRDLTKQVADLQTKLAQAEQRAELLEKLTNEKDKLIAQYQEALEKVEAKLAASEWVRKDSALRTYDGLTEKIDQAEARMELLEAVAAAAREHAELNISETQNRLCDTLRALDAAEEKKP